MKGKVYLLGAGPGDKGLLTLKGYETLKTADVVVYDRLVGKDILKLIPSNAKMIDVGKRAGNHPVPQDEINRILLNEALAGNTVVRLKGGDGFLFGRGGEELELLKQNHVLFEVIPGIPSAIAAPAYAGIPITHRDFCSSVHFISGHRRKGGKLDINYKALAEIDGTLIFMMSIASCGEIAKGLMEAGFSGGMDAAIIENGTLPDQRKFVTSLEKLEKTVKEEHIISPALIVVGKVCSLSEKFEWFGKQQMRNVKVLVTSPSESASKLAGLLEAEGARVTTQPTIKTESIEFELPCISEYKMVVFTSAAGVRSVFAVLRHNGLDARWFGNAKIAAVGESCAKELSLCGITADFVPSVFKGKVLGNELISTGAVSAGDKALLLRAENASRDLPDILTENGINIREIPVYKTQSLLMENIQPGSFDWIAFSSAGCVDSFAKSCPNTDFSNIKALCIGPRTAARAEKFGMRVFVPEKATLDSMADYLIEVSNNVQSAKNS